MNQSQGILRAGELLNNTYVIEELVGMGGTGEVYRAKNMVTGREFAIKILKPEFAADEAFINLMRREADVLHNVINDAVVRYNELLRSEMHGGFVFLVMEFIRGPQLAEIITARGPVAPADLLLIAHRMGQGLKAAHDKKAFHRDMSPDNIILPDGDPAKAKLIDFGIARDISENAQTVVGGGFAGKYQFASPEQLDGDVDGRSDLYSLGMTLLNAYRGKPINVGSSLMEIVKAKSQRPDTRDVPGQLGALIARLVEPNPADRFQSADEMLRWIDGGGASAAAPEATVVLPRADNGALSFQEHATLPPEPGQAGGGGGKLLILILLAALGGAGWYFGVGPGKDLLFAPEYARADTYRLELKSIGGLAPVTVAGHMPDPEQGVAARSAFAATFDPIQVDTTFEYASGSPSESWGDDIASMARAAVALTQWSMVVEGKTVTLTGTAFSQDLADAVIAQTRQMTSAAGYSLSAEVGLPVVEVRSLNVAALTADIQKYATCGMLQISGGNGVEIGPEDSVTVLGIVAREDDVDVLDLVLGDLVEGRNVDYNLVVLNAPVCSVEAMLPTNRTGGIQFEFSYGKRDGANTNGIFHGGEPPENPVIDVLIPAGDGGFLYAFYIDAHGKVFHLLPHQARQAHTLPSIGSVENGMRRVRLTFPESTASTSKLGFNVAEPYGTNMVVTVLSSEPLFQGLRARSESVEAFREALNEAQEVLGHDQTKVARRYLVTEP